MIMYQPNLVNNTAQAVGSVRMDTIDRAVVFVNQAMQSDNSYLDLSELLLVPRYNEPSLSGLQEHDYPSLNNIQRGAGLHEIGQIKKTSLPPELVERFAYMQCNCLMGLFPAIKRAWLSIDSDIFIWNYEDGSDVAYFDGLSETILCAAIVKPKSGIFQPHIVYLLCLATAVDVVLLGVSFGQTGNEAHNKLNRYEEMHLLPEPLFAVPTDNIHMTSIESTDNGRIFMSGKDGCLHELFYQAEDGWFSRRCRKINHSQSKLSFLIPSFLNFTFADDDPLIQIRIDETRCLLYTLSERGNIQMFDIGNDAYNQMAKCTAAISYQTIIHNATLIARNVEKSNFQPIVHISAISKFESSNIHLVAVTHTGTRLYFTTTAFTANQQQQGTSQSQMKHNMLGLVHVRLPPGYTIQSTQGRPMNVHSAFYKKGFLLLASSQSEDSDNIWLLSPDNFPFQRQLSESHEVMSLGGRSWSVGQVPSNVQSNPNLNRISVSIVACERPDPPAVVTQHLQIEEKFVIINSQGTTVVTKQSPVDQLEQLLLQFGPDSEPVKAYFRLHKEQACATGLVLMCSRSHLQVNDIATRAFFLYSGEPDYVFGSSVPAGMNSSVALPPASSTPINVTRHLNFQSPGTSLIAPPGTGVGGTHAVDVASPTAFGPQIDFSNKQKSLFLYLARIIRPLWENRMVTEVIQILKTKNKIIHLTSVFESEQLMWILHKLMELRDFLEINSSAFASSALLSDSFVQGMTPYQTRTLNGMPSDEQATIKYRANAELEENISLKQLQELISLSCEYLGLWKILCDHQFNIIAKTLTQDQQMILQNMTFEQLVISGRDTCQALAKALVYMYIDDNAATDVINARLREICPSLYSCHDEMYSKGSEKLKSAKMIGCGMDRDRLVNEALKEFKKIATRVDLPSVSSQFSSLKFYNGIVDLAMTAANQRDSQSLALHYYNNRKPSDDIQGSQAYNIRMDCYKVIMETMEYLLSTTHFNPQAASVPKAPGPPPINDAGRLSSAEAEQHIEEMSNMILASRDQMVHVAFYDWLIYKDMSEKLLEINSPFLEQYLKNGVIGLQGEMLDLLWRYYEKQKNFLAAARILSKLAEKQSQLSLKQRIEYLSRAAISAKSCTSHTSVAGEGEFLHELEEKMEVARLQVLISDVLSNNIDKYQNDEVHHALDRLNSQLLEISVLYSDFAEAFGLSECKLAIVHCAGHFDPTLVETLWREIIDKDLELTARHENRIRIHSLYTKLVSEGKKYIGTENYFPLVFLVKYLEKLSCNPRLNLDETDVKFVFLAMLEIGVQFPRLFNIYDKIFKSKDSDWKNNRKPYHLLFVIHQLLNDFVNRPQTVPTYERRQFATQALDAVSSYLVELQAETTANVGHLMTQLRDVQARLQRVQ